MSGLHKQLSALKAAINTCDLHASRIIIALKHVEKNFPLSSEDVANFQDEELGYFEILTNRFVKLQDHMGGRLFPALLTYLDIETSTTTPLDRLAKLAKLELLPSENFWLEMRELRNDLAHEYPDNPAATAKALNQSLVHIQALVGYWLELKQKINERFLAKI